MRHVAARLGAGDVSVWAAAIASVAYAATVIAGVPALRQDWGIFPFNASWREVFTSGVNGWALAGIGMPRPYPAPYLIATPLAFLTALFGNHGALLLFLLATGALCAFGARAIAKDAGCTASGIVAAILFVLFNPWAYTELVAGHTFMLLAYGASIWFFRELTRAAPRPALLVLFALLMAQQLQFFLIATLALATLAAWRRVWQPFAIVTLAWLPNVIGIVADRSSLASIPFLLAWERNQSVAPLDALQLNGYFAHYGDAFRNAFACGVLVTLGIAVAAAFVAARERRVWVAAFGTLVALVAATGLRGPFAGAFAWSVLHVHAIGLYRELYDTLGYAAIGYAGLAAVACARVRSAQWLWLVAALLLPAVWLIAPPQRLWVVASSLPQIVIPSSTNARYALLPAFQPMSFDGRGSGSDPDMRVTPSDVTPLNDYESTYPADAALGAFMQTGDVHALEALSVASVVVRPWLAIDDAALAQQWALPMRAWSRRPATALRLRPAPELALLAMPAIGTLDARLGSGDVFFGDAAGLRGALVPATWSQFSRTTRVVAPSSETHAADGWVDARLAFAQRPDLAQAFGGAITTNARATLAVRDDLEALVDVEGTLRDGAGRPIVGTTHGYRWIRIPAGTHLVSCDGLCIVAAQGMPPRAPLEPPVHRARAVAFHLRVPWMLDASLPAGAAGALRYNSTFDDGWRAYLNGVRLVHLQLDGTVNGWLVPVRGRPEPLLLVHVPSALQCAAEALALAVIAIAALRALWQGSR